MSGELLTFLKYIFLALLYLFFLRVLRAVWTELREPKAVAAVAVQAAAPLSEAPRRGRGRPNKPLRLVVREPKEGSGQAFELGEELTIGRAPGCGISLPDDTFVSQLHTRVFRREGDLLVEDLGSTNGTYLNGKRVSAPVRLRRGDKLQVGKTVLELSR
ncbi:MAG: FHA domain-containing protein [Acidimicrobiales bacterium]